MVQRGKGIEQRVISGRCAIFLSLCGRIDPESCKRDPYHAGIKKLPSAFSRSNPVDLCRDSNAKWLHLNEFMDVDGYLQHP